MEQSGWGRLAVSRRQIVLAGGAVVMGAALTADEVDDLLGRAAGAKKAGKVIVDRIRRASDLLVVDVVLYNLVLQKNRGSWVLRTEGLKTGYVTMILPPQSMGEHTIADDVQARALHVEMAFPTVLGFQVQSGSQIPYSVAGLLKVALSRPVYDKIIAAKPKSGVERQETRAPGDGLPPIEPPPPQALFHGTVIEAPYRMFIQQHQATRWLHDTAPKALTVGDGPRTTELWHTRLMGRHTRLNKQTGLPERFLDPRGLADKVVAVRNTFTDGDDFNPPLRFLDRQAIVDNAKDFTTSYDNDGLVATAPVRADQLILTPLGATLDFHGNWPGSLNGLLSWDHRSVLGRDSYVKVVATGWLVPYRHRAVVIDITERRMQLSPDTGDGSRVTQARLIKRRALIILDPEADVSLQDLRTQGGATRGLPFPFTKVVCKQTFTSGLPARSAITGGFLVEEFVDGGIRPLQLPFVGYDHSGQEFPFSSPVWFVAGPEKNGTNGPDPGDGSNGGATPLNPATDAAKWERWNTDPIPRLVPLDGATVTVAPEAPEFPGLTTFPTSALTVQVETFPGAYPPWRPKAAELYLDTPGVGAFSDTGYAKHSYHQTYLDDEDNFGGIVLAVSGDGAVIDDDKAGGLLPLPTYQGHSRTSGAILAQQAQALTTLGGPTAPSPAALITDLFEGIKLLGPLSLADIIDPTTITFDPVPRKGVQGAAKKKAGVPAGSGVPGVTHEVRDGRVIIDLDLSLPLKFLPSDGVIAFKPGPDPLRIRAHIESGGGRPAESVIDARLRNVAVQFADAIALPITEFRVRMGSNGKSFDFEISNVQFLNELSFLQPLSDFLQLGSAKGSLGRKEARALRKRPFGDPTGTALMKASSDPVQGVDAWVDTAGLHVAAGFGLPDVPLGPFSLTGLNLGMELNLPFGDGMELHVFFATFERQFQVTYCAFGGGGFVDVAIGELPSGKFGLKRVTAALSVCARLGIDLVVASGELAVEVGVVITVEPEVGASFMAYFRISGTVSIPLVASASASFELSMTFRPGSGDKPTMITGTATFLLDVQVLVVSAEYEATLTKTFKGGRSGKPLSAKRDPFARAAALDSGTADDGPRGFRDVHPTADTWKEFAAAFAGS